MIRHIIESYGVGSIAMQKLFSFYREEPREVIDAEYEDLSDQINDKPEIESNQQLLIAQNYVDTDNK